MQSGLLVKAIGKLQSDEDVQPGLKHPSDGTLGMFLVLLGCLYHLYHTPSVMCTIMGVSALDVSWGCLFVSYRIT